MSWKWPWLVFLLMACGTGEDEHPPLLGDCMTCSQGPTGGGGSSGAPDGGFAIDSGNSNNGDAALFDRLDIVDVGAGFHDVLP